MGRDQWSTTVDDGPPISLKCIRRVVEFETKADEQVRQSVEELSTKDNRSRRHPYKPAAEHTVATFFQVSSNARRRDNRPIRRPSSRPPRRPPVIEPFDNGPAKSV